MLKEGGKNVQIYMRNRVYWEKLIKVKQEQKPWKLERHGSSSSSSSSSENCFTLHSNNQTEIEEATLSLQKNKERKEKPF